MKQNLKKINIYSNLLNDSVNSFDDFIEVKNGLDKFNSSLKDDLSINTFFKSKTVDNVEKMSLFEKAVSNSMSVILVEVLKVVIENDDINLLKDVAKNFILLSKQKLNIAFVEVVSSNEMNSDQKDDITNSLSELINKKIDINFDVDKNLIGPRSKLCRMPSRRSTRRPGVALRTRLIRLMLALPSCSLKYLEAVLLA
jgi:F-type H+-transporting ATPase subunit delta